MSTQAQVSSESRVPQAAAWFQAGESRYPGDDAQLPATPQFQFTCCQSRLLQVCLKMRWRQRAGEDCWSTSRSCRHHVIRTGGKVSCRTRTPSEKRWMSTTSPSGGLERDLKTSALDSVDYYAFSFSFWGKVFHEICVLISALMIQSSMKSSRWEHLLTSILDNTDFEIHLHVMWKKHCLYFKGHLLSDNYSDTKTLL